MTGSSPASPTEARIPSSHGLSDSLVLVWRNLKRLPRQPDMVMYGTIQPIMFVVLFAYVFGGSITIGGSSDPASTASS